MTLLFHYLVVFSLTLFIYVLLLNHMRNGSFLNSSGLLQSFRVWHLYPFVVGAITMYLNWNAPINWGISSYGVLFWAHGYYVGTTKK